MVFDLKVTYRINYACVYLLPRYIEMNIIHIDNTFWEAVQTDYKFRDSLADYFMEMFTTRKICCSSQDFS